MNISVLYLKFNHNLSFTAITCTLSIYVIFSYMTTFNVIIRFWGFSLDSLSFTRNSKIKSPQWCTQNIYMHAMRALSFCFWHSKSLSCTLNARSNPWNFKTWPHYTGILLNPQLALHSFTVMHYPLVLFIKSSRRFSSCVLSERDDMVRAISHRASHQSRVHTRSELWLF